MLAIGILIWVLSPIVALAILWQHASSASLAVPTSAWVVVEAPPETLVKTADLVMIWSEEPRLVAPEWSGVVQSVDLSQGDEIRDGSTICVIDGVSRLAWHSAVPFYRPIGYGDDGPDVAALNDLLARQQLPHDPGDYAGWQTVRGIREYAESIGVGRSDVFKPAWVIYLSVESEISSIELFIGAPAPSSGSTIATLSRDLQAATVTEASALSDLAGLSGVDQTTGSPTSEFNQTIVPLTLGPEDIVSLNGVQIAVDAESGYVAPTSLAIIEVMVTSGQTLTQVKVETPIPSEAVAIPYGAIATVSDSSCVVRRDLDGEEAVEVHPVLPGQGRIYVVGQLEIGDEVLIPPLPMIECPPPTA